MAGNRKKPLVTAPGFLALVKRIDPFLAGEVAFQALLPIGEIDKSGAEKGRRV
jgi:hypothetical protein